MTPSRLLLAAVVLAAGRPARADEGADFFENKIRPALVAHCYQCHSADAEKAGKLKGGLRLDTRDATRKGGDSGPAVVPGKSGEGTLLASLRYDGDVQMPPKGKLPAAVVADFEKWVAAGAADPRDGAAAVAGLDVAKGREFWAFQPPKAVAPPKITDPAWARTDVDRFVRAKLDEMGLAPVGPADPRTLLRRVTVDLTGLPPTPEEVDAFLADCNAASGSSDSAIRVPHSALARVVDRLLASPAYGERWARHWLDVARYAEDQAHTFAVKPKANAFRYRDWVIKAFNDDMPYDRFVRLQLAGDLVPASEGDAFTRLTGLGIIGLGAEYYKNSAKEQAIADELDDRVDTVTRGFLGLTVACARCHDHKFDPVPQADYYAIAGVFNGFSNADVPLAPADDVKRYDDAQKRVKEQQDKVDAVLTAAGRSAARDAAALTAKYLAAVRTLAATKGATDKVAKDAGLHAYFLARWVKFLDSNAAKRLPELADWFALSPKADANDVAATAEKVQAVVAKVMTDTAAAKGSGANLLKTMQGANGPLSVAPADAEKLFLPASGKAELVSLRAEVERRKAASPPMYPVAHAIKGGGQGMRVFVRGNPLKPGDPAPKGFLQVISTDGAKRGDGYTRLDLANAIASPDNPLTARVIVNRVWERHFGRGLVATPSNFGKLGDRPSHPELLDTLAAKFMANGWSLKWLHREIVLSATYQLSSTAEPMASKAGAKSAEAVDPANVYLWKSNRRRLDVEAWRDGLLAVAGTLDRTPGGPTYDLRDPNARRRTVYAKVSRHELASLLRLFDFPDANVTSDRRLSTTVPQQQLFALNSEFMILQAKAFAARVQKSAGDDAGRVQAAYRLAFGRAPSDREAALGLAFLAAKGDPADKLTRWEQYAQVLLASNEMMYVD